MEVRPIHNERDCEDACRMVSGLGHARWLALHKAEHSPLELPESEAERVAPSQ